MVKAMPLFLLDTKFEGKTKCGICGSWVQADWSHAIITKDGLAGFCCEECMKKSDFSYPQDIGGTFEILQDMAHLGNLFIENGTLMFKLAQGEVELVGVSQEKMREGKFDELEDNSNPGV